MTKINPESKIKDIIEEYPEILPVFAASGFKANTKQELMEQTGETLMLKTALKARGINHELFIKMLREYISERVQIIPAQNDPAQKLDFIGYTYCPLKLTFKEYFEEALKKYLELTEDMDFKYYIPSGCSNSDPYDDLWKSQKIEQLPEIIASIGFGDFFRQEFVEKFVNKGYFKALTYPDMNQEFIDAGLIDPKGWYTVYSVFPMVMLVDKKRLGSLPVPEQWSDLLSPVYKNNIIIGASHGDIHEDLFLYIYKEYGDEGIIKLAANIKNGWHGSQMAKIAGTNNSEGAAVYVILSMFARSCPRTEATTVIWPRDGALTTPGYMLVKDGAESAYKPFIDFITGSDYGQKSADNHFPVLNKAVNNKLCEGAKLKWLGWDYIRANSIEKLKEHVKEVFYQNWKGSLESKGIAL